MDLKKQEEKLKKEEQKTADQINQQEKELTNYIVKNYSDKLELIFKYEKQLEFDVPTVNYNYDGTGMDYYNRCNLHLSKDKNGSKFYWIWVRLDIFLKIMDFWEEFKKHIEQTINYYYKKYKKEEDIRKYIQEQSIKEREQEVEKIKNYSNFKFD